MHSQDHLFHAPTMAQLPDVKLMCLHSLREYMQQPYNVNMLVINIGDQEVNNCNRFVDALRALIDIGTIVHLYLRFRVKEHEVGYVCYALKDTDTVALLSFRRGVTGSWCTDMRCFLKTEGRDKIKVLANIWRRGNPVCKPPMCADIEQLLPGQFVVERTDDWLI